MYLKYYNEFCKCCLYNCSAARFLPLASVCISKYSPKLKAQSLTFAFGNRSECALSFCFLQPF